MHTINSMLCVHCVFRVRALRFFYLCHMSSVRCVRCVYATQRTQPPCMKEEQAKCFSHPPATYSQMFVFCVLPVNVMYSCTLSEWYEPWRYVVLSWSRLKAVPAAGVVHNRTIIVDRCCGRIAVIYLLN